MRFKVICLSKHDIGTLYIKWVYKSDIFSQSYIVYWTLRSVTKLLAFLYYWLFGILFINYVYWNFLRLVSAVISSDVLNIFGQKNWCLLRWSSHFIVAKLTFGHFLVNNIFITNSLNFVFCFVLCMRHNIIVYNLFRNKLCFPCFSMVCIIWDYHAHLSDTDILILKNHLTFETCILIFGLYY